MVDIIINGDTSDKKFASIERFLNRLARRSKTTTTVMMPATPVSIYTDQLDSTGCFYTFVSAIAGSIKKVCAEVQIEKFKNATISISIQRKTMSPGIQLPIIEGMCTFDTDIAVEVGDKIAFTLKELKTAVPNNVTAPFIALGFSIVTTTSEAEKTAIAITAVEEAKNEILSN
ncbi:MAG: hypothetical protein WC208_15015 [Gallionella sp.]|jgi:hypothetical protein